MNRKWTLPVVWLMWMVAAPGQVKDFDPLGENERLSAAKMIRCTVELIEVPTMFLSEAVAEESQTLPRDDKIWKKARELATEGEKAKMVDCVVLVTKPGLPCRVESNLERIYATEYDPPPVPQPEETKEAAAGAPAPKPAAPAPVVAPVPQLPFLPVAFDTRGVGTTVELDPVVSPEGDLVDITISVEHVIDLGDHILATWKDEHTEIPMTMPKFHAIRVRTQACIPDGHVILAGASSPADAEGKLDPTRKVLVFVRIDVVSTADRKKP